MLESSQDDIINSFKSNLLDLNLDQITDILAKQIFGYIPFSNSEFSLFEQNADLFNLRSPNKMANFAYDTINNSISSILNLDNYSIKESFLENLISTPIIEANHKIHSAFEHGINLTKKLERYNIIDGAISIVLTSLDIFSQLMGKKVGSQHQSKKVMKNVIISKECPSFEELSEEEDEKLDEEYTGINQKEKLDEENTGTNQEREKRQEKIKKLKEQLEIAEKFNNIIENKHEGKGGLML
jgi:hypothetical protein